MDIRRDPKKLETEAAKVCRAIEVGIRRHVDEVSSIHLTFDTVEQCSHCLYPWEVWLATDEDNKSGTKTGKPVCCDAAIREWENEQVTK